MSLFALSESATQSVYKYLEQRTLNLVTPDVFLILTDRASLRRAVCKKSLISLICFGYVGVKTIARVVVVSRLPSSSFARVVTLSPSIVLAASQFAFTRDATRARDRSHRSSASKTHSTDPSRSLPSSRAAPRDVHASRSIDRSTGSPNDASTRARERSLPVSPRPPRTLQRTHPHVPIPSHRPIVPSSPTHHRQLADRRKETARFLASPLVASRRLPRSHLASSLPVPPP